jgi:hypothetical protein
MPDSKNNPKTNTANVKESIPFGSVKPVCANTPATNNAGGIVSATNQPRQSTTQSPVEKSIPFANVKPKPPNEAASNQSTGQNSTTEQSSGKE